MTFVFLYGLSWQAEAQACVDHDNLVPRRRRRITSADSAGPNFSSEIVILNPRGMSLIRSGLN